MTNQKTTNYIKYQKSLISNFSRQIVKPSTYKSKSPLPITKIYNNSVYNFNLNLIKNIPNTDRASENLIKTFFTINPLTNNRLGIKSKLSTRRYKRSTLNKILISKPEIKQDTDTVSVSLHIYNKKNHSILRNVKKRLLRFKSLGIKKYRSRLFNKKHRAKRNSSPKLIVKKKAQNMLNKYKS